MLYSNKSWTKKVLAHVKYFNLSCAHLHKPPDNSRHSLFTVQNRAQITNDTVIRSQFGERPINDPPLLRADVTYSDFLLPRKKRKRRNNTRSTLRLPNFAKTRKIRARPSGRNFYRVNNRNSADTDGRLDAGRLEGEEVGGIKVRGNLFRYDSRIPDFIS